MHSAMLELRAYVGARNRYYEEGDVCVCVCFLFFAVKLSMYDEINRGYIFRSRSELQYR